MARDGSNFIFGLFFALFTPLTTEKSKWKKKKKSGDITLHVYQKLWSHDVRFLKRSAWKTDGQTDGQTKGQTDGWTKWLKIFYINDFKKELTS